MDSSKAKIAFCFLALSIFVILQAKAQMVVRDCEIKNVLQGARLSYLMGESGLETYDRKKNSKLSVQLDTTTYTLRATTYQLPHNRNIEVAHNDSLLLLRCGTKVHVLKLNNYKSIGVIGFKYLEESPHCYFQLVTSSCRYYFSVAFHQGKEELISIVDYDTKPTIN